MAIEIYLASHAEMKVWSGLTQKVLGVIEDAEEDLATSAENLKEYFEGNIIHRGIKFSALKGESWLELPLAGGRIVVYVESDAEAILLSSFKDRKEAEIEGLEVDVNIRRGMIHQAWVLGIDELSDETLAAPKYRYATLLVQAVDIKRMFEYVKLLRRVLKDEIADNPGTGEAHTGVSNG